MKKETVKEKCDFCDKPAYKTDSHNFICENRAYTGKCEGNQPINLKHTGNARQSRNDKCACGSGLKYKKCCGK